MTEFENSRIAKKVKELSKDIENISFKFLERNNTTGGITDRVLLEPDFLVVVGNIRQISGPDGYETPPMCSCFYGGEKMECIPRRRFPDSTVKDKPDRYFRMVVVEEFDEKSKASGEKISEDVYTDCPIRKLAQIVSRAYHQGKAEGKK